MDTKNKLRYSLLLCCTYFAVHASSSVLQSSTLRVAGMEPIDRANQLLAKKKDLTHVEIDDTIRALDAEKPSSTIQTLTTKKNRLERAIKTLLASSSEQNQKIVSMRVTENEFSKLYVSLNQELLEYCESLAEKTIGVRLLDVDSAAIKNLREQERALLKSLVELIERKQTLSEGDWHAQREHQLELLKEKIKDIDINPDLNRLLSTAAPGVGSYDDDDNTTSSTSTAPVPKTSSFNSFGKKASAAAPVDERLVITDAIVAMSSLMLLPKGLWLASHTKEFGAVKSKMMNLKAVKPVARSTGSFSIETDLQKDTEAPYVQMQNDEWDEIEAFADSTILENEEIMTAVSPQEKLNHLIEQIRTALGMLLDNGKLISLLSQDSKLTERELYQRQAQLSKTESELKKERDRLSQYKDLIGKLEKKKSDLSKGMQ